MKTIFIISLVLVLGIYGSLECKSVPINNKVNRHKRPIGTTRPIIGVLAQSAKHEPFENAGKSYIAASYIKYLESAGARVVPVKNDLTEEEVEKLFHSINGFLLPGGGVNLAKSGYQRVGEHMFNLALQAFENNDYFPIWGTCLGFQFLSILASSDDELLSRTDSENLPIPLNFTSEYHTSRMFENMSQNLSKSLSNTPITLNMHHYSVLTEKFKANKKLGEFFRILSTNTDRNGMEFVSTMEGIKYPVYATQWHPEKNPFEWTLNENIPHGAMAIQAAQYMANFFVNEARYSSHKFETIQEEQAALIYNFNPMYTGNISNFEQSYIFM